GSIKVRLNEAPGFDVRHSQYVFGQRIDQHVNHVVNCDDADDSAVVFEHGHVQQVVLGDLVGDGLLIVDGLNDYGFSPHHFGYWLIHFSHHQIAQADRAE